ncbi:Terminase-like family protein [Aeoliella mucimassa]|uniref:Terminase-like family protein n=2 Tax=Aeoliella mucimassa TaxID=2527972 RepID=A0A518AHW6_9BACT|nr:Terminase-like family protein [Aeoliella mucimassa]
MNNSEAKRTTLTHATTQRWWSRLARGLETALRRRTSASESVDLLHWGRQYLPTHFVAPPSGMHRWLAGELNTLHARRGTKLNVIGPRGGAKSTIATLAYVLRMACEAREPYVWIVSDTRQQAQIHLENVKAELSGNPRLAARYPLACRPGGRWQAAAVELANGVALEAYGTGQRIRGRRRNEHRPTLIVCDDIQNDGHMSSGLQRASSRDWFHGTLLKAGTPNTNVVNLATALHRDALAMQLQTTPGWHSRLFRAIERWPRRDDLWQHWQQLYDKATDQAATDTAREFYERHREQMEAGAELLWPEVEDLYTLMTMRCESGRTAFEREKQGAPIDPDGCEWPEEYFGEHLWFDTWPDDVRLRTIALDPSKGTDARRGDYSAYAMLAIGSDGTLYVEADLARRGTPQMVTDGVALCERFRPAVFGVEANQWQELLEAEFVAEFRRQGRWDIQPAAITNTTNKQVRIRRLGPYLSRRRLRFKRDSPSTRLLVDQLRDFPGGTHDDGPDALEMALRLAEELWR